MSRTLVILLLLWSPLCTAPTLCLAEDVPDFPLYQTQGLLPKSETGALRLREEHPTFDGRGTIVAIFDSGVDPGAAGLQTTSDGRPKIIDMVDGTGSGDIDTSTVRQAQDGYLDGLSGRRLKLNPGWTNPSGNWHVGYKAAFELFPAGLITRLKAQRREDWETRHREVAAQLRAELDAFNHQHPQPSGELKEQGEELQARWEQLQAAYQRYEDFGPVIDCVVFHDGERWRAVVDTNEDGDLTDETPLAEFRHAQQYGTFQLGAELNFGVNIYDQGKILSLVTDCSSHGTHVAGIVAAYFPNRPELCGVAPGAQIVSVKIGDTRLGSMETGAGLERGIAAVLRNQCDLINMSYGEPAKTPDHGRLVRLLSHLVDEHGVIFISSAGNAGPALSTVGAPGGTSSSIMGVGAYVSPEMMRTEYALRESLPGMPYTWTSRGPTADGDAGVDIFAPGGAIAPIPNWTLARNQQMNGTSMASPNACGNIALLLSALKAREIPYTPHSIRRAVQNTAIPIARADEYAQGPGLIQVDRALEYLLRDEQPVLPRFEVRVDSAAHRRGIYLREPVASATSQTFRVRVTPRYPRHADHRQAIDFELPVVLKTTADWVRAGGQVSLSAGGVGFEVFVDPTKLSPGVHRSEIQGLSASSPEDGPLFRVPVTVVRPHAMPEQSYNEGVSLTPGQIERRFIAVPAGATWANIHLRNDSDGDRMFVLHTVQLVPGQSFEDHERRQYLTLPPGGETVQAVAVEPGYMLEVCLGQWWMSLGDSRVEMNLEFHGVTTSQRSLALVPHQPVSSVQLAAELAPIRIAPTGNIDRVRTTLLPTKSQVSILTGDRDQLFDGRQIHQVVVDYTFDQSTPGSVTPRFPALDELLYDSPYGTATWQIRDAGGRLVAMDDYDPSPSRLGRGRHTLQLTVRHDDPHELEVLTSTPLWLERPLRSQLSLKFYPSLTASRDGKPGFTARRLRTGELTPVWVGLTSEDLSRSGASPGEVLLGTVTYASLENSGGSSHRPGGFPVQVVVGERPPTRPTASGEQKSEPATSPAEQLTAGLLTNHIARLKALPADQDELFEQQAAEILTTHPAHLPLLVARLERLDTPARRPVDQPEIIAAADAVIAAIDTEAILRALALRPLPTDNAALQQQATAEKQKQHLIDALYRKGRALGYQQGPLELELSKLGKQYQPGSALDDEEMQERLRQTPLKDAMVNDLLFHETFDQLRQWVDTTAPDYALLHVRWLRRQGNAGQALKTLEAKYRDAPPELFHYKKRRDLYEDLGWPHLYEAAARELLIRFPNQREQALLGE